MSELKWGESQHESGFVPGHDAKSRVSRKPAYEARSRSDLKSRLDAIERDVAAGILDAIPGFDALRDDVLHWTNHSGELRFLRRLAKLLAMVGESREAIALLRKGTAISPQDEQTALLLSDALASQNEELPALQALAPLLDRQPPHRESLKRASLLCQRVGNLDGRLEFARRAAELYPERAGIYLSALKTAGRNEEALTYARNLLAAGAEYPQTQYACYTTLRRLGSDESEISQCRDRLLEHDEVRKCAARWRARILRDEGQYELAAVEMEAALAAEPDNLGLIKELAGLALAEGYWGRDAAILLKARGLAAPFSNLAHEISQADLLLRSYGGSLESAAGAPDKFSHVVTPECVFERVVQATPSAKDSDSRRGLVMIAGSLAGGGAERVLSIMFRHLSQEPRFEWAKLYVCDLSPETGKDFYLPLTGLSRAEVVVPDKNCSVEPPLAWLGRAHAQSASSILEQLRRDRPAVVHSSLEPLNIYAGLAAVLAGVPRIVLHTHNMRPTELGMSRAHRMRACYKALMQRPEVSIVGCARACVEDYVQWLGLEDRSKTHVVYNGFDADDIVPANNSYERSLLRAAHGFNPETLVIGTAFRFTKIKQPLLWVDAAEAVLSRFPSARFVMFGDGELHSSTSGYIRQKGLASFFILPGRVTDIYRRLAMLDLFVLSSSSEGLPNVLLEAQAAGVPVISFDVGGVGETMIDGVTGSLVKEQSASALAEEIVWALTTPAWRHSAAAAARSFVRESFDAGTMVRRLSDILLQRTPSSSDARIVKKAAA